MAHAPNVSTEAVPMRLVRQLLARYRHHLVGGGGGSDGAERMQGDQEQGGSEEDDDDFHFQTRQINIIAQEGESMGKQS